MNNYIFVLSSLFLVGCLGLALKPSPIYGGLGLIVSGFVGCLMVLGFGGSFLGLMVFLIYLGGMLVVFGYTTAMAIEEYPEAWGSGVEVLVSVLVGLAMEVGLVLWVKEYDGVVVVVNFNSVGSWMIYEGEGSGLIREDPIGAGALYDYGRWLVVVTGWTLFVGVYIVIEIARGN